MTIPTDLRAPRRGSRQILFSSFLMLAVLMPMGGCDRGDVEPRELVYAVADTGEVRVPEELSDFCQPGQESLRRGEPVPDPPPWSKSEAVPFQEVFFSGDSYVGEPLRCVIRREEQWDKLQPAVMSDRPPPSGIDFNTHMLLVASMGSQPTAGYRVRITDVRRTEDGLIVVVYSRSPGGGSVGLMVTEPVHAVLIPRDETPVRFIETRR